MDPLEKWSYPSALSASAWKILWRAPIIGSNNHPLQEMPTYSMDPSERGCGGLGSVQELINMSLANLLLWLRHNIDSSFWGGDLMDLCSVEWANLGNKHFLLLRHWLLQCPGKLHIALDILKHTTCHCSLPLPYCAEKTKAPPPTPVFVTSPTFHSLCSPLSC